MIALSQMIALDWNSSLFFPFFNPSNVFLECTAAVFSKSKSGYSFFSPKHAFGVSACLCPLPQMADQLADQMANQ